MLHTYFLGANTPLGFRSEYDGLRTDGRIRILRILKGGPGCGKSTLMKTVASHAERSGYSVERIPCSSDPDSLDGVVIPELGAAIVDGTAPHVVEPDLCGAGHDYVNLGACYRKELLQPMESALRAAKASNAACYGPAYAALAASAEVRRMMRQAAEQAGASDVLRRAGEQMLSDLPASEGASGLLRKCYLSVFTPTGLKTCLPEVKTLWVIRDGFCLAAPLLRNLAKRWRSAGEPVILAMDPMQPDQPAGLFLPRKDLGYWRVDPVFEAPCSLLILDLEEPILDALPREVRARIGAMLRTRKELSENCVFWLRRAKAFHDVLEELYRPAVDFAAADEAAEALAAELLPHGIN